MENVVVQPCRACAKYAALMKANSTIELQRTLNPPHVEDPVKEAVASQHSPLCNMIH